MGFAGGLDGGKVARIGQIEAMRVPTWVEEVGARLDGGAAGSHRLQLGQRAGGDALGGEFDVDDLVDEAGIGAVLQKPADEVGEEVAVRPHRRVDAAACGVLGQDDLVQAFPHAVQALKFVGACGDVSFLGDVQDGRDGMGVVGGELRIDTVSHRQEFAGVGEVAGVGALLAREYRERGQAEGLGALDLAVPVGAFYQTDHDLAVEFGGQVVKPVDHRA